MTEIERVLRALEQSGVRSLVVGGVAVVLHGHPRFTADLDLAIALEPANVHAAFAALASLGYRPRVPVSAEAFAAPEERRRLIAEKSLTVLSFASPELPMTEVDVFADPPFAFEETWQRATVVALGDLRVRVASIRDVIAMKRRVGRAKDLEDVAALERLARNRGETLDGG
jgi:predicted nucleotidyltransferase